jgi:hypothetical protein
MLTEWLRGNPMPVDVEARSPENFCFLGSKTNFNTLGTTSTALSNFGKVLTVHDARVVQLSLKFNF